MNNLGPVAVGIISEFCSKEAFILAKDIIQCEKAGFVLSADSYKNSIGHYADRIIRLQGELLNVA